MISQHLGTATECCRKRSFAKKRDGNTLTSEEIAEFVVGLTSGATSDAQAAAFAMAVLLKKMSLEERVVLTKAMRDSGQVMRWDLPGQSSTNIPPAGLAIMSA